MDLTNIINKTPKKKFVFPSGKINLFEMTKKERIEYLKKNPNAKLLFYQEWDLWLSAGYIDLAVPMNYMVDNDDFVQNMYMIKDNLPLKYHNQIIVGISTYNQSAKSAGKKILRLKKMRFNNISIFSYSEFVKNPYYWKKLKKYF